MKLRQGILFAATLGAIALMPAAAQAKDKTFEVCPDGCEYTQIQEAVDAVKDGASTTIEVGEGEYNDPTIITGQKRSGLTIKNAPGTQPQIIGPGFKRKSYGDGTNGIEAINLSHIKVKGLYVADWPLNGVYIHATPGKDCVGFEMNHMTASFNRSYGLFALHCQGGRIVNSEAYGHGDSGIYIGETPPRKPSQQKWTEIANNDIHENVLGYSGTNSKYVDIHDNDFYNNGAGVVPNTLESELFQPNKDGIIRDNNIFWNNYNYYYPESPVQTVSGGLGTIPPPLGNNEVINYPTGVGVVLFGSRGWQVKNNEIFGNFHWGVALISNPFNPEALSANNKILDNSMGRSGTDTNAVDFWSDGSGRFNCFEGNTPGSTFGFAPGSTVTMDFLYSECPAPAPPDSGTNQSNGEEKQVNQLVDYVVSDPPCQQEAQWTKHAHPAFDGRTPVELTGTCDS
jgi:hypothetical protein